MKGVEWVSILKGNVWLYFIIFCVWIEGAIIFERFLYFFTAHLNREDFLKRIVRLLTQGLTVEATDLCDRYNKPFARVLRAGLEGLDGGEELVRLKMENACQKEIIQMEHFLPLLETFIYLAPMLGFLGTVAGFIKVFLRVQEIGGFAGIGDLAGGVWQALICAAAGIGAAVLGFVPYRFFRTRVDHFIADVNVAVGELVEYVGGGGYEGV